MSQRSCSPGECPSANLLPLLQQLAASLEGIRAETNSNFGEVRKDVSLVNERISANGESVGRLEEQVNALKQSTEKAQASFEANLNNPGDGIHPRLRQLEIAHARDVGSKGLRTFAMRYVLPSVASILSGTAAVWGMVKTGHLR